MNEQEKVEKAEVEQTPRQEMQEHLNYWAHMLPPAFMVRMETFRDKHFPAPPEPEAPPKSAEQIAADERTNADAERIADLEKQLAEAKEKSAPQS